MSLGTVFIHLREGDGPFTRTVLPEHLVSYFKIDSVKVAPGADSAESRWPKVPSFRFSDGTLFSESIPITLLIVEQIPNNGGLLGKGTPAEYSQVLQWMNRFNFDFMNPLTVPFKMVKGAIPYDQEQYDVNTEQYVRELNVYEQHLTKNTYLVGESATVADLYGAAMFLRPLTFLFDKEVRAKYPAVMRWFETIKAHPVYQGFFDDLEYVDVLKLPPH